MNHATFLRNCLIVLLTLLSINHVIASQSLDDPLFPRQWQFKGNSIPSVPNNYRLGVIDIENNRGKGEENVIMVISFGIKTDHEDLVA